MRNSNGSKYIIIMALLISVVALSVGFAALSSTLTIKSSATVSNDEGFDVRLSSSKTALATNNITPTTSGGATGTAATISAGTAGQGNQISGIAATFTAPGQSVVYTLAAYNNGIFAGYLKSITFGSKTCTAGTGTTQSYVNSACTGISITVKVGTTTYNATNSSISGHSLAVGAGEDVVVTVAYASGSAVADGDFTVAFGDIVLNYSSTDA